jgi:hypothetical protein
MTRVTTVPARTMLPALMLWLRTGGGALGAVVVGAGALVDEVAGSFVEVVGPDAALVVVLS